MAENKHFLRCIQTFSSIKTFINHKNPKHDVNLKKKISSFWTSVDTSMGQLNTEKSCKGLCLQTEGRNISRVINLCWRSVLILPSRKLSSEGNTEKVGYRAVIEFTNGRSVRIKILDSTVMDKSRKLCAVGADRMVKACS